jgi:serine/threonine protein phosphatase PrpC
VIRGMPYLSGKTENKLEKYMNPKTMPCDDASSESDNFLSVFDGVGACGVWSGKFARQLAIEARRHSKNEVCLFDKDKELTKDKDNRSITILKSAHRKSIENLEKRMKEPGASTAVVLSLTSCPGTSGQKHVLHECVYGDSRWALLRKKGEGYECAYLSHEMYYAQRSDRPMTPMQLQSPSQKLHEGSKFYWKFRYVYEDDVVIVGSDGLFDNLVIEGSRRKPSDEVLKLELERAMQETCERCKDGCEVCKVMRDEGRIPVLCIGEHLQRVASENMKRTGGKPDDLAITVSRISMGTRPDLTKQTCTEMKVSAICSDVFSRA